jgi:hypothetical protein
VEVRCERGDLNMVHCYIQLWMAGLQWIYMIYIAHIYVFPSFQRRLWPEY